MAEEKAVGACGRRPKGEPKKMDTGCSSQCKSRSSEDPAEGSLSCNKEAERSLAAALEGVSAQFDAVESKGAVAGLDATAVLYTTHPTTFCKDTIATCIQRPAGRACTRSTLGSLLRPTQLQVPGYYKPKSGTGQTGKSKVSSDPLPASGGQDSDSSRGKEQQQSCSFGVDSVHDKVNKWLAELPLSRIELELVAAAAGDAKEKGQYLLSPLASNHQERPGDPWSVSVLQTQHNPEAQELAQQTHGTKHTAQVQWRQERRRKHRKFLELAISTKMAKEPVTLPLELQWCKSRRDRQARTGIPSLLSWNSADSELVHSIGISSAEEQTTGRQPKGREGLQPRIIPSTLLDNICGK